MEWEPEKKRVNPTLLYNRCAVLGLVVHVNVIKIGCQNAVHIFITISVLLPLSCIFSLQIQCDCSNSYSFAII